MRMNDGNTLAVNQLKPCLDPFQKRRSFKNHNYQMFSSFFRGARHRNSFENYSSLILIVLKNSVCHNCETLGIINLSVRVDSQHIGSFRKILLP